jgi:hypothetical protein
MMTTSLFVVGVCVGLAIACSKEGPGDVDGNRGGAGGVGGTAAPGGVAGTAAPGGVGGTAAPGGTGGWIAVNGQLPCLTALFADCPTAPGTCQWVMLGGGGTSGFTTAKQCYAAGTTAMTTSAPRDCNGAIGVTRYEGTVFKTDGSPCYSFSRLCDCDVGCSKETYTFTDPSGTVVATGERTLSPAHTDFQCTSSRERCFGPTLLCAPDAPGSNCFQGTCP